MEGAHRSTRDSAAARLIERLGELDVRGDKAAEIVDAALTLGHSGTLDAGESSELDRATARAVLDSHEIDGLLDRVDLERMAALLERVAARASAVAAPSLELREPVWEVLDLVRRSALLRRIPADQTEAWAERMLAAIEASHFTVGELFRQRAKSYGSKVLFQIPGPLGTRTVSWRQAATRVEQITRALISLDPGGQPGPIAILSDNRIEMALVDLACLTGGLVNVMVPANATESHVSFILGHAGVRTVVVSERGQLDKFQANRDSLPRLRHVISLDAVSDEGGGVLSLRELLARASRTPETSPRERSAGVRIDDLATVMYTSGTTGTPKGIQFSQRNLVFKRFARGLALPEIGENDVLLCFLPLFHTFGRFLEMLGCVYWGATYCFLENPSVETLVRGMRRFRPTVFISVPKKWMQLHEAIAHKADPVEATDDELVEATRETTGGRLRWGLSAAGHLDSDIFRFFQRQGIELMSGFGMTEATGGITMTPPGEYRDGSLGKALPGIELRLAPDGELCVRGPYVMMGYLDPAGGEPSFDDEGWLHTGDLMREDSEGYLRLVDRKKEIYKNIKGETIAPQRIENMFRDFDSVGRAFLVGDQCEYNTLLIYPNYAYQELDFRALTPQETKAHFRSLVVSVNKFLAPFERIVDFAVIDRDLDAERGELTPKGTPRRRQIVENFREVIRLLYRRTNLQVGGLELTLPNWLLRTVGLTAQDIRVVEDRILLPQDGVSLTVREAENGLARIGSCYYRHPSGPVNLGALLTTPRLWLGNAELVDFVELDPAQRYRPGRPEGGIEWAGQVEPRAADPADSEALQSARAGTQADLLTLHRAALLLGSSDSAAALDALPFLEAVVAEKESPLAQPARLLLLRAAAAESWEVARRAFLVLVPVAKEERFRSVVERFLARRPSVLDSESRAELSRKFLPGPKIDVIIELAREASLDEQEDPAARAVPLLQLLAAYGASHPASFRKLRAFLERMAVFAATDEARTQAVEAAAALRRGFRAWLGPSARIAVDPETGQEYHWDDVVVFDDRVPEADRSRILAAIKNTAIIREASFLFFKGIMLRLDDIPPGGVWIRLLGARHGKSVYRMTLQTRFHGSYDLAINLNQSLSREQVEEEIRWLLLASGTGSQEPLVEEFGGYWREQDLWSEEFVSGETLDRALRRLAKRAGKEERFKQLWPFLAWTALSAYVDFWDRTGRRWEIADADMSNVIVPTDDYHTGVRIVSVSARRRHGGLLEMMRAFMQEFIEPAERQYPPLEGLVGWDVVFSSVLEVIGEDHGLELFRKALESRTGDDELVDKLRGYVDTVRVRGFLPRRLFFAVKRYRRWAKLSSDATPQACARTLQELYDTYGLQRLVQEYPEIRVRLFRETVFREAPPQLVEGLDHLIAEMRSGELIGDDLIDAVAELRARLELGADDDYFLTRVSLPYLRPEDDADFVSSELGGRHQSEIVVTLEDSDARPFQVRHALNPKEVGRLHRLFESAKLDVRFRPEHRYLVAINDRQQIIGGIYYEVEDRGESAHLEKIVVAETYRRKGVADGLMKDFFNRLRTARVKAVTTGFFRPGYFYTYGFRIEKRYAGLVKSLEDEES